MKALFLSMFDGFFKTEINKIFLTSTDVFSDRMLIVEEDKYSVWAYFLEPNQEDNGFDGFLCATENSELSRIREKGIMVNGSSPSLMTPFLSEHSHIKNLKKRDIKIHWEKERVLIFIKNTVYLIMDINRKKSYSKSLNINCKYGNKLDNYSQKR